MFSYYGSKSKVVDCYPKPKQDIIIEPFAGSARYALKWFDRKVILNDRYKTVIEVWQYLKEVSETELMQLCKLNLTYRLSDIIAKGSVEYNFLGFLTQAGQGSPADTLSSMRDADYFRTQIKQIAKQLFKIRHWQFTNVSYDEIENQNATWFIDPPYQFGGEHQYRFNNKTIDFVKLAEWCRARQGQIIVCENTKANWMEFKPMQKMNGTAYTTTEAIWSNEKTAFDNEQILLQF